MNNKYFDLLPIQHQTSVNKNFFESTVEQLFAKANIEQISGYVGRKVPGVDNNTNTVFVEQPAPNREFYNLEPTVTTINKSTGKADNFTFYEDFIFNHRTNGGLIGNHDRVFKTEQYNFAPPIDLDKFVNYQNYYWYAPGPEPIQVLGNASVLITIDNLVGLKHFTSPNNVIFKSGMVVQFSGSYVQGTNYKVGQSYIVEGVGTEITFEDVPTSELSISAYGEFETQPYDANAVPNAFSTGSFSNVDVVGNNAMGNILALANTNINDATFDFDIARPVEISSVSNTTVRASFESKYGEAVVNGNNVRINIFDDTNKVVSDSSTTAYGFVGAYLTLADGSSPIKTLDLTATFSDAGGDINTDTEVITNKLFLNNVTDIHVGVDITHPDVGQATVTTVNSDHVVISASVTIYNNSSTSITFGNQKPQFTIDSGSGAKTITLDSGSTGEELKLSDINTYTSVANAAIIVSPLDLMNAINDASISNISAIANTSKLEIIEANGNAVTITNVTNDARNNPFVGVNNTSGLNSTNLAIDKTNVENLNFAISNKTSTTFDIVLPSGTAQLVKNNGTFINYGSNLSANVVQLYSEDKQVQAGANVFFDKTIGTLTAGTPTQVVGTPDTKTFFINTGVQAYGGQQSGSNFTQPRNGKFNLPAYSQFLNANSSVQPAANALVGLQSANADTISYDVSQTGALLTYAWDGASWDNTPIQNIADYLVIARGSKNKNPWSRLNYWYHVDALKEPLKDNVKNFSIPTGAIRAVRPILEFDRDMELHNWGNSFISTVDIVADKPKEELEGLQIGFPINSSSGSEGSTIIFPNNESDVAKKIYEIADSNGLIQFNEVVNLSANVVTGGHVFSTGGTNAGKDYFWNGNRWQQAQQKIKVQQPPKFTLYDDEGVKVDNIAKYPNSDFTGCPVFSYNENDSTGTYDSILKANIVYQSGKFSSEPTFHNHVETHTVKYKTTATANAVTIPGYLYFKDLNQDYQGRDNALFRNNWHPVSLPSKYRNFSNVATYYEGEVVKFENNYFVANANITAGNFDISNYKFYEEVYPTTSKQYVEDVIQITDITANSNVFVTSALPNNNDIIVYKNNELLNLGTDYTIITDNQGIKLSDSITLIKGDLLNVKTFTKKDRLTTIDAYGFFEIPEVLKFNPRNELIRHISFSDTMEHFHSMISSQTGFTGSITGSNNFKDTAKDLSTTRVSIAQTSDDILTPMYFTKSSTREFSNSLRFGRNEYVKFKNKFLGSTESYLVNNDYLEQTNLEIIDTILKTIKNSKISKDAHKLTYMAPIGTNYTQSTINVSDASVVDYTFDNTANVSIDTTLYVITHNNNVLCSEKDFTIESTLPFDIKLDSSITLAKNDILELRVYEDSEPALIPSSLSKLGMWPAYEPMFMTDTSYQTDLDVIRCHDGSYIPRQNDKIDDIILDFETLIYNNIKEEYRKADRSEEYCFIKDIKPSKYYDADYEWHEINDLLENNFNKWIRATGIDWRDNSSYDEANEFTWNYTSDFKQPGHWRGIFDYYYDTQTPNTTPWEMFGFVKKPSWWNSQYPLAITSSYSAFWDNVRTGYIPAGSKKGYHKRWARPNVDIPVDTNGNLLSPQDIIYTSATSSDITNRNNWKFGDGAPAEYAWKKSSYYPFAVAEAMYLARPALFFATYFDKSDRVRSIASPLQVISKFEGKRCGFENYEPHGFVNDSGKITIKFGISTLVDSYLKFQSLITNVEVVTPIRTIDTRLGHKFGGFINDKNLKVFSDSISVDGFSAGQRIPKEDVVTALHTSGYNSRNFYTGVKITKTATGFSVSGFDSVSQVFDIIPSDKSGPAQGVAEGGTPVDFSIFDTAVAYPQNSFIKLGSTYYQAKENVQPGTFDTAQWTKLAEIPTQGGAQATYFQRPLGKTDKVPYNKHYESVADVFDLLISIGRHQQASGFDFGEFDTSISDINDWLLAGRRFLFWTTENHDQNDSIVLSPMANKIEFQSSTGKISEIKNSLKEQYSLIDSEGKMINIRDCLIVRQDNSITITPPETKQIFGCLIHTELVEHAMVINNTTAFNDLIYNNKLGVRQDRLDIQTQRSKNWDGRYSAEGLIISSSGSVLPNFDLLVDSIRFYHDNGQQTIDPTKTDLARELIGFEKSTSLANVKLTDAAQFDFYKGTIRNKGTANSITSVLRSNVVNTNKNIEISEEWAIKRGEFGDVFNHQSMDISLKQSDFITDNQQVEILYPEDITGAVSNIFVYERNTTYFKVPTVEIDPPTEGNAATATAKLFANALLESVTITSGGDGYASKPNVAVITGNIVVARIDEVLQNGLAFSNADVDVPLTGSSAISNISITDYTTASNISVDVDLANSRTIEHVVSQINKQLNLANVTDVVAFGDIDSDLEKFNISSITAGTPVIVNAGSNHGFNPASTTRANASIQSITSADTAILTLDTAAIGTGSFSSGDTILFQGVTGGTGFDALNNTTFYVKETGTNYQYELYTDKSLSTGANTSSYTGNASGGDAYASANVDYIKIAGLTSVSNGNYYALHDPTRSSNPHSSTQFELYQDPSCVVPVTNVGSVVGDTGTVEVLGSGGNKRLYIRGSDFQLSESTLPGGNPSTSLSVLNMTAGRYQPQQRFAIQTANNTTTSDIIVTIGGTTVNSSFYTFDNGNRSINNLSSSQLNSKLVNDSFTVDLVGTGKMLDQNIVEVDGQYPYIEFYIDGKEIFNSPNYRAIDVSNAISNTTRVTFSNVSEYANNISLGANVTISEMGTVQFANTLVTDTPGSKLSIKSVANDTLIANTTSIRTYKVTEDNPNDNRITIDIDDTEQMLKRPTNTIDKGIWPSTSNTRFSIPNAGYVNRANVEWEAFNIQNFDNIVGTGRINNPIADQYLHLAKSENEDWNVYQLKLHGYIEQNNTLAGAKNFVDNVDGQTMLFTDTPLSVYTDGNILGEGENRFFDNHVLIKNADLSNIVLRWSNEQVIATPRTIYTGTYVPLKRINRKITSIAPGGSGSITEALPNTADIYTTKIFAKLSVPLSNVEFFRSAGVIQDKRDPSITNSVLVTVDNVEGLEPERRADTGTPDNVYFYGAGATAANITVGKAYPVTEVSGIDTQDGGAGSFYITEANITASDYARIGTGNCFVGFESILRADEEAQITGITPSTGKITFKATGLTDLTNGTNVSLTTTSSLSSVDTVPDNFYTVADVNVTAKTFSVTSSEFRFHNASVAKTGFNKLGVTTLPLGQGIHAIVSGGSSDRITGAWQDPVQLESNATVTKFNLPDFVHFTTDSTSFSGNIYPVIQTRQSDESGATFSTISDTSVTTSAVSNVVVYKGEYQSIQGDITRLNTENLLTISNFDSRKIGAYGLGRMDSLNSNTDVKTESIPSLSGKQFILNKPSSNVVTMNPSLAVRNLTTNFIVDIDRNNDNTADIRIRDDVSAGDLKKLLFTASRDTSKSLDMLEKAFINYGTSGTRGVNKSDWTSSYNGNPMYIGPLSNGMDLTFDTIFDQPPESFRKIDEVEAELEFRYISEADLETLKSLTATFDSTTNYPTPMAREQDIDWWIDTYSKPMYKPSLDGFKMQMNVVSGSAEVNNSGGDSSTLINLWNRFPGENSSSNFASPNSRHVTVSEIHGQIDENNPVVKLKFRDDGLGISQGLEFIDRFENNSGRHSNQSFKNRYKLKNQNKGNEYHLMPHHPSASTRPMEWWSNDVKNTMIQGGLNRVRINLGYEEGVTTYPTAVPENRILPIVIVKKLNVKYTLSPVTNLKLDNLRISIAGGNISGIKDYKIDSVQNTFFTIDNSDNAITVDELSGDVRAVIYRQDDERNKSILVNDLGSPIKLSDPSDKGYSAMLFTTTNANSSFNTGTVFGYVPHKQEHFTNAGSMFIGIPNSRKSFIKDWLDDDLNADIKYLPLNYTGHKTPGFTNANITFNMAVYKNESKIFTNTEGLSNTDVVNINDTLNVSALEGQSNIVSIGKTFISIAKGETDSIITHAIPEANSSNLEIIANSALSQNRLTITNSGHDLKPGSTVIMHTGNASDYLNNTSFRVREVTPNTFTINVANTNVIPTSNISNLKYGATFTGFNGNIDLQYYIDTTKVYHFSVNRKNNVFGPGDNVRFYAGTIDSAGLDGTTAIVDAGTDAVLSLPLTTRPTSLTPNLSIRFADDVNKNIVTMPPKYEINNLFAKVPSNELGDWAGFAGELDINISTFDTENKINRKFAEFSGFLGNRVPDDFVYLPLKIFTATDFVSPDHGVGKYTSYARVLSTTAASSEGLVNVRLENAGVDLYEKGTIKFSQSLEGHVLNGNEYQILDFMVEIDENGDQGTQHYTIKAPGATATTNEFTVSYTAYKANSDRALKFIKNGKYNGYATPVELTKDVITVETPYLGPLPEDNSGFWVNDILLIKGSSDLGSELKLRPKLDTLIISGAIQRNLNAKYRIALQTLVDKSPYSEDPDIGDSKIVPVYGFSNHKERIDLSNQQVTYTLGDWNTVKVNGAKTSIESTRNIRDVADSLNFAAEFKEGAIRRTGSISASFMFGERDVMVDNPLSPVYNKKYVNVPKNTLNLNKVSVAVSDRDMGNHIKQGVTKFVDTLPRLNNEKYATQAITGQHMLDMNNLGSIIDIGNKATKLTRIGAGMTIPPVLDDKSLHNETVLENHHNSTNKHLSPYLQKDIADYAHEKYKEIAYTIAQQKFPTEPELRDLRPGDLIIDPDIVPDPSDIFMNLLNTHNNLKNGINVKGPTIDMEPSVTGPIADCTPTGNMFIPSFCPSGKEDENGCCYPIGWTPGPQGPGPQGPGPQGPGPQGPGPQGPQGPNCGSFSITLFDINNAGSAPADVEIDDDLYSIVQQYYNILNNDYSREEEPATVRGQYGFFQAFMAAGGNRQLWLQYLAMLNGNLSSSDSKIKYNEAIIDLCEANPGFVKVLDGNLCSNSGEVMFLGNQRINLQDNCDPCALADGINSQNSDYRAICGEPTSEEVNCVIPGGGQATGDTQFGDVVDLTTGFHYIEDAIRWGGKRIKVKGDDTKYLVNCWGEVTDRRDPLTIRIISSKPGQGFSGLVEQILNDRGVDPIEGGYKTIVLRMIASSEDKGDLIDRKIIGSGSGTQPKWYDIRHHGKDTCNWINVDWTQMKVKGGPGLNLGGAEIRFKGFKPGVSYYKIELQLSKHDDKDFGGRADGHKLRQMNYDLTKSGRNAHRSEFGQNLVLGLLVRGLAFCDGGLETYAEFEQTTNEETGWGYKKIVGYGDKMGGPDSGREKDRTYGDRDNDGFTKQNTYFKTLWAKHPVQQRRKAGCFNDIDIPILQAVKIKSAVPFSLGLGCSRSPFTEVGDFMPYVEKTTRASANLALGATLTNEEYHQKSIGGGFTAPKVLTTKASAGGIQLAEATGVPSQSNPFMTADYLRIDGLALTPRSGEGTRSGGSTTEKDANVSFNAGDVEDSTGFNYRIGDKLSIVGGQPKSIDNSAYFLDKIEIQNPGLGYNPADTRFEIVDKNDHRNKLPGVHVRGVYSPNTANLEPTVKVTGKTASSYSHSFYREYIESGGGTDKTWISKQTIPNMIETYTSSVEELAVEGKRVDIPVEDSQAFNSTTFKISCRNDLLESGRKYRAFIGTRDYENAGAMMMFGLGIHDRLEFGEDLIKNSKVYDAFSTDELAGLAGSWLCVWEIPNGTVFPNGHNPSQNFSTLSENSLGVLKVFMDSDRYEEEIIIDQTGQLEDDDDDTDTQTRAYSHFISESVQRFNGRIVKFLRVSQNRVFFKVETTLGLEKSPNFEAYGVPDFANLWSRFYPIENMNDYQNDYVKTNRQKPGDPSTDIQVRISIDDNGQYTSKNITRYPALDGSGNPISGQWNGFSFNQVDDGTEQYVNARLIYSRTTLGDESSGNQPHPLNQQWDLFIIQEDVSTGYLRMPFMGHVSDKLITITAIDEDGNQTRREEHVTATRLANAMQKIHYNTVYRPVSTPYVKMGESEALVFKFNFNKIPKDAVIQNIDIDFILRSTMPGDYGMIWLQAPDGSRLPLMQFLGKYGTNGQYNQGGMISGRDYKNLGSGAQEMIFTISSKNDATYVQPEGSNLRSYGSKVMPDTGYWNRSDHNYGRDLQGIIYGSDYDSDSGSNLKKVANTRWNSRTQNLLTNWIKGGETTAFSTPIILPDAITYEQLDKSLIITKDLNTLSPNLEFDLRTMLSMNPGDTTTISAIIDAINAIHHDLRELREDQFITAHEGVEPNMWELRSSNTFAISRSPAVLGMEALREYSSGKNRKMNGDWYIEITRPGRNLSYVNDSNILARRPDSSTNVGITEYTTAVKAPNIKISYISPTEDPNYDNLNKDTITRLEVIQRGGFQPEFAMRNWVVKAIGSGTGFKGRAILSKGELLAEDNPDMIEQSAQFEVTEINTAGSITKLRVLDRGVYEIFPAEQERGIPLKYVDDSDASQRLEGPGFGARVICSARSVIDCRQPPQLVLDNAGPARPETPVEALADVINTQVGPDGGLTAEVVDVNPDVQQLVFTSDGDGFELSDVVPGTLGAIGIPQGEYSPQAIGFRAEVGNPGTDFGVGDGNQTGDGNPFNRSGDGDSLIMYNVSVPPEFEGLTSTGFGNIFRYDLSKVDGSSVMNSGLQSDVDVLYLESRRFQVPFDIKEDGGKNWIDRYDVTGWAHLEDGSIKLRQDKLVDSSKLKNAIVYQKDNGERVTDVTLHDPFKGFIVPEAERNLTYISDGDPVHYNNDGSNFSKDNVGELWWNTGAMRVRWYEQASVDYRADYWGSYVTGSSFEVYEWIESKDIPSEYTGQGTPFSLDDYVIDQVFNRKTNAYSNTYYYWVRDLESIPEGKTDRTISARQVERLIESPKNELIPTYGVVDKNTMLFNNLKEYLTDDNSVLQSNFSRKDTKYENKHETYTLLGENAELSRIPEDLINKLIDSIAGEDNQGNIVPDKNLNKYEMYGIKIRPRQTMFMKVNEARRTLRTFLNREISKIILTSDVYKGWDSNIATNNLYEIVDWVEQGYISSDVKARLSVKSFKDMLALTNVEDGVFVRLIDENNPDRIYEYDSVAKEYNLVKVVNGTLRIKPEFYTNKQDSILALEIRQLLRNIIDIVFKFGNLTNKMYFAMLNYILTEQYQTEWFFKSSYFNIRQSADNLEQKISTKIDPFGDMSDYIKTVKPYTSKLRDFNDRKTHTEITKSFASDFDKPPYQPNLSVQARILDPGVSADANILSSNSEYTNWANTYISAPSKVRTMTEKIFIDRNQSNIMALGNATISNTIANAYSQPTSFTAESRMSQLINDPANATPINHIERLFVYHPTIKDLNTKIANTTFSNDIITGLKATRLTTLRILAYANFQGEELDANLFSKAYYDGIGNEILATEFGYDQTSFDSDNYDSDIVVNNYLANTTLDSELVRDSVTYAGFDSNTFFKGYAGPDRPPEHVLLHALEGVQFNVQSGSQSSGANVSFKMFLGLNGAVEYTRIATDFSTTLSSALSKTSDSITVADSTKLTSPYSGSKESVIYVGDERITYGAIDGNTLKDITRGTLGTSIEDHASGTKVIDASEQNRIEIGSQEFSTTNNDPEIAYWNDANVALADSNTTIAQFLRDKPGSYFD